MCGVHSVVCSGVLYLLWSDLSLSYVWVARGAQTTFGFKTSYGSDGECCVGMLVGEYFVDIFVCVVVVGCGRWNGVVFCVVVVFPDVFHVSMNRWVVIHVV